jgi:endonuclease YncB( thermonuclease family)
MSLRLMPLPAALLAIACLVPFAAAHPRGAEREGIVVAVPARATVVVRTRSAAELRVRLIGVRSQSPAACLGAAALAQLRSLALGKRVQVVEDPSQRRRMLHAYVQRGRIDLGRWLVRKGYAVVAYRRPFARLGAYRVAAAAARFEEEGRWSSRCPMLSVQLDRDLSTVTAGNTLVYTVGVRNRHEAPVRHVQLRLAFSERVRLVLRDQRCHGAAAAMVCDLGNLRALNNVATRAAVPRGPGFLQFAVSPLEPGILRAEAVVTSAAADAYPPDNHDGVQTSVARGPARADLALTMQQVPADGLVAFELKVTNLGPTEATGIALQTSFSGGEPRSLACWKVCPVPHAVIPAHLGVGDEGIVRLAVVPRAGEIVTFSGSVRALTRDPSRANNSASMTVSP